jgi:hypothetical protein
LIIIYKQPWLARKCNCSSQKSLLTRGIGTQDLWLRILDLRPLDQPAVKCVIHKEGLCLSSWDINRLMIMMMIIIIIYLKLKIQMKSKESSHLLLDMIWYGQFTHGVYYIIFPLAIKIRIVVLMSVSRKIVISKSLLRYLSSVIAMWFCNSFCQPFWSNVYWFYFKS